MKYWLSAITIILVTLVMRILAPILLIPILFTARYVGKNPDGIKLYKLPNIFNWFITPDDVLLPAGLYEPTVKDVYDKWGWYVASWYWLGIRNVFHGFAYMFSKPCPSWHEVFLMSEQERQERGLWKKITKVGVVNVITGYSIYSTKQNLIYDPELKYYAVPVFTLRWANQD